MRTAAGHLSLFKCKLDLEIGVEHTVPNIVASKIDLVFVEGDKEVAFSRRREREERGVKSHIEYNLAAAHRFTVVKGYTDIACNLTAEFFERKDSL